MSPGGGHMRDVIGITVSEALELRRLNNLEVVAGEQGLDRKIVKINIMEVPDIIDWVEEGELLFTTLYSISNDEEALKNLIPNLAEKKLAALGIKPGRYVKDIPEFMKEQAEKYDMPLLEIPYEYSFSELINSILQEIVNVQTEFLQRTLEIHEDLTSIAFSHEGLGNLCSQLRKRTDNPVLIMDDEGEIMASCLYDEHEKNETGLQGDEFIRTARLDREQEEKADIPPGDYKESEVEMEGGVYKQIRLPVKSGENYFGFLYTWEINSRFNLLDINTLKWAATIALLNILNQREMTEIKRRYKNELLHDIVEGQIEDRENILQRSDHMGLDLRGERMVIIFDTKKIVNKYMIDRDISYRESVQDKIFNTVEKEAGEGVVTGLLGSYIVVFFPVSEDDFQGSRESVEAYLKSVKNRLSREYYSHLKIGVGNRVNDVRSLQKSFRQAERAIFVAEKFAEDSDNVFFYKKLGVYKLFYQVRDDELGNFIDNILQPLLEYDRSHDTEMVKTLDAYFEAGGNLSKVADELYIHYNTAGYRIKRIEKITGMDLDSPDDRLNLEIALKLYRMNSHE